MWTWGPLWAGGFERLGDFTLVCVNLGVLWGRRGVRGSWCFFGSDHMVSKYLFNFLSVHRRPSRVQNLYMCALMSFF